MWDRFRVWFGEVVAFVTAAAVVAAVDDVTHTSTNWWAIILSIIVFGGIFAIAENAINGQQRLGIALDAVETDLTAKIDKLERSIQQASNETALK